VKSGTKVYPILLLHGWPGSVREFYELIPKLTAQSPDKDFVFEVVAPSLPGYGFSEAAAKTGLGITEMAIIMRNLMIRLGFEKFYVQGGDWGSMIGNDVLTLFPENVLGYHSNMCTVMTPIQTIKTLVGSLYPSYFIDEAHISYYYPLTPKFKTLLVESGYMHIQATKPDTIGTGLSDTPIGLAAYILEKFSTWTDPALRQQPDGGLEKHFTKDALLDNVMIYFLSNSIVTSMRLYAEAFSTNAFDSDLFRVPVDNPVACAKFKNDLAHELDWALRDKYTNLVQVSHYDNGGHFAAMQLPQVMYDDIVSFVKKAQRA
jgi:juvenile hormone epoxide hydrolase